MGIEEIIKKADYGHTRCDYCLQKIPARLTDEEERELRLFNRYNSFIRNFLKFFSGGSYSYGETERNSMTVFDLIKHKLYEDINYPDISKLINSVWIDLGKRVKS